MACIVVLYFEMFDFG
ncbi:hypothetical protein F383_35498 [Gossypium arboreum]|uniref:Uncharacterized protein n=1 Tax=Gossypium arboreum TaxID=29729 RepID=A0A0B0N7D3_GOSAR|nr:hypothetical protein F383_35498 [Gossypium arboreum]